MPDEVKMFFAFIIVSGIYVSALYVLASMLGVQDSIVMYFVYGFFVLLIAYASFSQCSDY